VMMMTREMLSVMSGMRKIITKCGGIGRGRRDLSVLEIEAEVEVEVMQVRLE
jgi:hypothetical protein